ncbi:MAG: MarR family winged helix-turn-helix transcriptional regulator [Spirosomaceae bacterium]|jgi:DNA-binding MarR family transcriptional regulator|nr:MarR family winged helix-turn-helix transcriptional regulator [Spirosomataceae bacterium]
MSNNKLVELVNLWAAHEAEQPDLSIEAFCERILATRGNTYQAINEYGIPLEGKIMGHLGRMGKFASIYSKKALQETALNNVEDWVYLLCTMEMGTPKKSELINQLLSEFPSGIDVIKRMVAAGYLEEFPDEEDKRSKRVRITPAGVEKVQACLPQMQKVGDMALGLLTPVEKQFLVTILDRLDRFHEKHYKTTRSEDFEALHQLLTSDFTNFVNK